MSTRTLVRKLAAVGILPNAFGMFSIYTGDRFISFDCPAAAWHAWKESNASR
jgi:hypothetical protein